MSARAPEPGQDTAQPDYHRNPAFRLVKLVCRPGDTRKTAEGRPGERAGRPSSFPERPGHLILERFYEVGKGGPRTRLDEGLDRHAGNEGLAFELVQLVLRDGDAHRI